jgi:hypothetical protein
MPPEEDELPQAASVAASATAPIAASHRPLRLNLVTLFPARPSANILVASNRRVMKK